MNEHSADASELSRQSLNPPSVSPSMSSQSEERSADGAQRSLSSTQRNHHPPSYADKLFYRYHQHSISYSTAASGSTDSSPTTTASTIDDSSATEPSPGSSPESPPPTTFSAGMLRPRTSPDNASPFFELAKQPPPKKGRNLKNLAVNTARNPRAASTTSLPSQGQEQQSQQLQNNSEAQDLKAPASPAFVKPPSPPKRKPSGLTLLTPGSTKISPQEVKVAVPPTPAGRPGTLRHFQSSPSLPLFPGLASQTGICQQGSRRGVPAPLDTILSPIEPSKQVVEIKEEEEPSYDLPLSKEEKPEAYPDGPICVYEPNIDLYLEPTAEQCRKYDVVMNVAAEVRNPLVKQAEAEQTETEIRIDGGGGIQYAPKHLQAHSLGEDAARDGSPTTPKATPLKVSFPEVSQTHTRGDPEYIHIPWEHNSDIVPDLLRLVKLIDEKVRQGKRVLIHCQCGVSRSASLVVAYGLYQDPTMSVQEAYDAVKARSKWIGPNMNLIMQLQEFRTSLTRGGLLSGHRGLTPITPSSAISEWRGPFSTNPSDPSCNAPLSAGLATGKQTATKEDVPAISPGPSSAPSGLQWPMPDSATTLPSKPQRPRAISTIKPASAYVDPAGHLVPVLKVVGPDAGESPEKPQMATPELGHDEQDSATPTEPLSSPRAAEFAMAPLQPPKEADPADSFGIMSPTSTEFASSPFDRSALLASLGMGSMQPDDAPRRAISTGSRKPNPPPVNVSASTPQQAPRAQQQQEAPDLASTRSPGLRGKISQPSIKEQKELHSLQAKIEASLPHRPAQPAPGFERGIDNMDDALMSPRATEFTHNPFALALNVPSGSHQDEAKISGQDASSSTNADPRSPAQQGVSPITRNIMDVL